MISFHTGSLLLSLSRLYIPLGKTSARIQAMQFMASDSSQSPGIMKHPLPRAVYPQESGKLRLLEVHETGDRVLRGKHININLLFRTR